MKIYNLTIPTISYYCDNSGSIEGLEIHAKSLLRSEANQLIIFLSFFHNGLR